MLEIILAAIVGILLGGAAVYFWITSGSTATSIQPSIGDITPFENDIIRMTRALVEEWETHKKKRSGLVTRNRDTEFILTIRRPLDEKKDEAVYYQQDPISNTVAP